MLLGKYCSPFHDAQDHRVDQALFLVGTKCDLQERVIRFTDGVSLASRYNVGFLETSAKTGENVEKLFRFVGEFALLLISNPPKAQPRREPVFD